MMVQGVLAWDGSGTSTDPYLIQNNADWRQLADDVIGGNSYSGKVFRMTADIDGSKATTIDDCHVSSRLFADSNLSSDATFGGLVAVVEGTCTASPVIKKYQ